MLWHPMLWHPMLLHPMHLLEIGHRDLGCWCSGQIKFVENADSETSKLHQMLQRKLGCWCKSSFSNGQIRFVVGTN